MAAEEETEDQTSNIYMAVSVQGNRIGIAYYDRAMGKVISEGDGQFTNRDMHVI